MAAVVVTHRRPRLATQVVRGLVELESIPARQVILVVNGEGGLEDQALEESITVVRLPENVGPAGGFRAGMLETLKLPGVAWIYLCEDDVGLFSLPSPRVVSLLSRVEALGDASVGAAVAYGQDRRGWTGHTIPHRVSATDGFEVVDNSAWGASLLSRRVLDAGVLPDPAYFFGFEDFDFWYQVRAAGFRIVVDRAAVASAGLTTTAGRADAFAGQRPADRDEPWRAFYTARNYFRLARKHGTPLWALAHLAYSARRWQVASSSAERSAIVAGLVAGVLGRSGRDDRFVRSVGEQAAPDPPLEVVGDRGVATRRRRVLHILPSDAARGAQVFARDLRAELDSPDQEHLLLTIFDGGEAVLAPDIRLDVRMGWLRSAGGDPRALREVRSALVRLSPDVVVAHGGEALKYVAPMADGRFALVYYAIGTVTPGALTGWRARLYRWLLGHCDAVVGVSAETLEEAINVFGVRPDRQVLLPNGRDPAMFYPSPARRDAGEPVALIFVGHLTGTKRPGWFIQAVEQLRASGRNVRGLLVGDGPMADELRAAAQGGAVEVLGRRYDVPDLLRHADLLVFPSEPESEGMPGVLIEAGLSGLPVVATRVPGANTVIEEGRTGFVVPYDDFDALVDRVARLVDDAELRQALGAAARDRCVALFSQQSVHDGWRTLLAALAPVGRLPST